MISSFKFHFSGKFVQESCEDLGGWRDPMEPFRFKIPPPPPAPLDDNEAGPSSEVGEVGRLELSNFTRSTDDSAPPEV